MKHAWEKGVLEGHAEGVRNGQTKMPSKAQTGPPAVKALSDPMQSSGSLDHPAKKPLPIGGQQLSGGAPNPLLLTPASLQLAQLQAQLTLHRLKLAQTAVGTNTAAAATVLNQVLSNVAMSQPFFNQLRTSSMVTTGGAQLGPGFPPRPLAFPAQAPALGTLVGGGFGCGGAPQNPNPGGVRLNCYGGGSPQPPSQHAPEYRKKAGMAGGTTFPSDTDRRMQFGFASGAPKSVEGLHVPVGAQTEAGSQAGFQRDYFGVDGQGQNLGAFPPAATHKEQQWQNPAGFPHAGQLDVPSSAGGTWATVRQPPFHARGELYNPEEPTADPKFNPAGGSAYSTGVQGFEGYQQVQPGDEALSGGPLTLQPHQLNDFHAVTPSHLPHQCSICEKKVYNLKDWDQHVKGKLHLQNRALYAEGPTVGSTLFPASAEGCLNSTLTNSMAYSSASNQEISSGNNSTYLHAAPMTAHPLSGPGFTLTGSKFPPRKTSPGRVVHICNLPEGSCTENDVINLGLPFGKVTNYILMRSTHQAFLEMAYVEAAQAMVQYYQLKPATINEQKLLIRMSKRYKELQLKKPGKDVESIIQDINSQRERHEKQEIDCYPPDRPRSRSPVSRSLSPRSHSPSFTSCSSAHSPSGPCRGEWSNSQGGRRCSWDWSSHMRRGAEEERDEPCWRNGDEDRPNGRLLADWRKPYFKPADRMSPRPVEERGSRDRYPRGSPQGPPFPPYRGKEEEFYKKEAAYKSDKPPRQAYPRREVRAKRRDVPERHRSRHSESETLEDSAAAKTPEDRKQASPARGTSKKLTRKQEKEVGGSENNEEEVEENRSKEKSGSPQSSCENVEAAEAEGDDWESGEDTEGEIWYPGNMEELVTVDEVGEEEDSIIEPDLPDHQEEAPVKNEAGEASWAEACQGSEREDVQEQEAAREEGPGFATPLQEKADSAPPEIGPGGPPTSTVTERQDTSDLSAFPSPAFQAVFDEACACMGVDTPLAPAPQDALANHRDACQDGRPSDILSDCETGGPLLIADTVTSDTQHKGEPSGETPRKDVHSTSLRESPRQQDFEVTTAGSPLWEQEKVLGEHSIPLGVEFIVPRSGFYCKLCGLFYTSEEKAKIAHCRSTVHYRNLQKYLSQLAEDSSPSQSLHTEPSCAE
ncbi:RNA-binding protein 20 [Megalops cyprinoides]|uniref:RNA-binding protein 20 n=1 Tax=Megalops cyprinoides TaxID=118141 RepID=UPI0018655C85|nr:RNA-binding protein 20 [Megalops cyprinoides]